MKSDVENLGLFIRQKLRDICKQRKVPCPEILIRGAYVLIKNRKFKNTMQFKSPVLAILLGWDYREWNGAPIKSLLSTMDLQGYEDTRNQSRKRELVLSEDMSNKISRSDGGE
ncbi:hypothetical protein OSTOST_17786 [Ostertagia ostertagi]